MARKSKVDVMRTWFAERRSVLVEERERIELEITMLDTILQKVEVVISPEAPANE